MAQRILPKKPMRSARVIMVAIACWMTMAGLFTNTQPVLAATLTITSTVDGGALPAVVGTSWIRTYTASGGTGPYTCSMSGSIPDVEFEPDNCTLSGTPGSFGSYTVVINFTDGTNTGSSTLDFVAEAETQIVATLRSTHPDGEAHYVAGFPVWVHANVDFDPLITDEQPSGTINVSSGTDEPSCSAELDENGEGECVLIFPTAGVRTVLIEYPEQTYVRSSTTSVEIEVLALHVPMSLSAGRNHTCHQASDGLMTCWGLEDGLPVDANNDPLPKGFFTKISAGGYQTCGLDVEGAISCWGDNTQVTQHIPIGEFIDLSSGDEHVCAIDTHNHIQCWGALSPALADEPSMKVTAVSAGVDHDCAIQKSNHRPVCWGAITTAPEIEVKALAVGNTHTCAVKTDGTLACWGTPTMTVPDGASFTTIASGSAYSCAQKSDGTITCWGSGAPGVDSSIAFHRFSSGFLHTCALQPNGSTDTLSCWGDNAYGKAPRIILAPTSMPQYLVKDQTFSRSFTASGGISPYTISVASDVLPTGLTLENGTISGTLTTPGAYSFGLSAAETFPGGALPMQLSPALRSYSTLVIDGATTLTLTLPGQVNAGSPAAVRVTINQIPALPAATGNVLVASADGDTYCRAEIDGGVAQCTLYFSQTGLQTVNVEYEGDQYFETSTTSGTITVIPVVIAPALGAGDQFSCSINAEGQLACWGKVEPFQLPTPSTGIYDQLDLGRSHACALRQNRQVACWGWNGYGIANPPAITGVIRVTAGNEHSCVLTDLGGVSCWGKNEANRLTVPSAGAGNKYTDVDAGADHTCAIDNTGAVKCWGLNGGDGRTDVPSDLLTRGRVTKINSGGTYSCAIHENGSLECWGGVGVVDSIRAEPTGVFTRVSAGQDFACALKSDGSVSCWGNRTTAPSGTFTSIAAGFDHACGILSSGRMQCWGENNLGQAPVIAISPSSIPTIDMQKFYTTGVSASGGRITQYTYSVTSGVLPAGLNLDSNTGVLSGTPSQAGSFTFTAQAQEKNLSPAIATARPYTFVVRGLVNATIDSALPAGVMVGKPVQVAFSVHARTGSDMGAVPTGTVTVSAEENQCEVELSNGTGTCTMLFGEAGIKTISIAYPGDALYQPSDPLDGELEYTVVAFSQAPQLRTGLNQSYIYKTDGTVGCIGDNCTLDGRYTRLGVGDDYACGLQTNGNLLCHSTGMDSVPPLVFSNGPYIDMSVGKAHVCALQIDGQAECLGDQTHGQSSPLSGVFNALSAGGGHTCALKENGEAICWGEINAPAAGTFTTLVSGDAHTCGLRSNGSLACWGTGSIEPINVPSSPGTFTQIASGGTQICGINLNNEITCWRVDAPENTFSPYGKFIAVATYDDHACGLREGLKLTCWGEDDAGEAPQFAFEPLDTDMIKALSYFEHAFNVTGGTKPLAGAVVEGILPPGVQVKPDPPVGVEPLSGMLLQDLSPAGMILYGTPNLPGVYPFVVRWTDVSSYPLMMEHAYTLTVAGGDLSVHLTPFSTAEALEELEYRFKAVVKNKTLLTVPSGVVLTIELPLGLTNVITDDPACALSGSALNCMVGAVAPSTPKTIWVTGHVDAQDGETLEFSASVKSLLTAWPEIDNVDNSDSFTVGVAHKSTVFSEDFELAPSSSWSGGTRETAQNGEKNYLSVHDKDEVLSLGLSDLPAHKNLVITFDLYVVGNWLGNNPDGNPGEWIFGVMGETPLLHTSFSNDPGYQQAYPGRWLGSNNPARQGSTGSNELEHESGGNALPDTRYRLSFKVPNTAEALQLVFSAPNLPDGAWWGLDCVSVMIDTGQTQVFLPLTINTK